MSGVSDYDDADSGDRLKLARLRRQLELEAIGPIGDRLLEACIGDFLGAGVSRRVFAWRPDPTLVVKIEYSEGYFQNAMEWKAWMALGRSPFGERWLLPCVSVSKDGRFLWQRLGDKAPWNTAGRAEAITDFAGIEEGAGIFCDHHDANWMWNEQAGLWQLADYGFVHPFDRLAQWEPPAADPVATKPRRAKKGA
jgi:hypothetical protein